MELTPLQTDALIEICNIGMSKAAKQLSALLDDDIDISVPKVSLMSVYDLEENLSFNKTEKVACVWQHLAGELHGRAMLLFNNEETNILTDTFYAALPTFTSSEIRDFEREAMIEVGNIIISSCFSAISDMLNQQVSLSVPAYTEDLIGKVIRKHLDEYTALDDIGAVAITTVLEAQRRDVTGNLLIILDVSSIKLLIKKVELMLTPQG